jgi:hypothetical protein
MDRNASPQYEVTNWNETRWNGCWNSEQGVGIYIHAGRYRHDLDVWWVQVAAYLPGGELVVDRFWGPNRSEAGIKVGCLDLEIIEDGWEARFDGAGQLTTTAALARAPRGSSAPFRRLRFDVTASAAAPQWDMYAHTTERLDFSAATHVQQGFTTSGSLRVGVPDEDEYRLDGVGFKDHSSGPREPRRSPYSAPARRVARRRSRAARVRTGRPLATRPHTGSVTTDGASSGAARVTSPGKLTAA